MIDDISAGKLYFVCYRPLTIVLFFTLNNVGQWPTSELMAVEYFFNIKNKPSKINTVIEFFP